MVNAAPQKPDRESEKPPKVADFPAATLAFYGPDDQRATKAVATVVLSEGDQKPAAIQEWHSEDTDVRNDPAIRQEILGFLKSQNIQRVVMADRIIGCPHVEGVDYPNGESCPYCPFWANRDRWTGQPLEER